METIYKDRAFSGLENKICSISRNKWDHGLLMLVLPYAS